MSLISQLQCFPTTKCELKNTWDHYKCTTKTPKDYLSYMEILCFKTQIAKVITIVTPLKQGTYKNKGLIQIETK